MRSVFVIGDSISIHYGPYLQQAIAPQLSYDRKRGTEDALKDLNNPIGANGGDSGMVLAYLQQQEQEHIHYDILLVNCGLHDIKTDPATRTKQVTPEQYEANLQQICQLGISMARSFVWVRTTPLVDEIHNQLASIYRFHEDLLQYNSIADKVMEQNDIPVIDLYTATLGMGKDEDVYCDHVHFKDDVRQRQAAFIAKQLLSIA
ncbi:SGNH/GDSL hydrolase family protein [Paenibacillus eucommiae]|uniref:Lysophospholipase L1-like esterase n=1 Tax=Paenibacillus eucommiae TaxID=1355755 RepID=A0ABS4ISL8_9BACL|nr:SGNH/GDSL hydrolase family protein [Paenibacillus eucommiae]MBP1990570.1 lysophospholipase L1-like esterase [Paenibacillus eucommiae]